MNIFWHFNLNKTEKAFMLGEYFVIVSNDGTFLADISERSAENWTHLSEKMTELVQNDTKIFDRDLILFFKTSINLSKVFLNVLEIKFFLFH
jgi:hypothetical protein